MARDGFEVTHGLARSLAGQLDEFKKFPASLAQFSKNGKPYESGDILKQPDLAKTLQRIADQGPAGFYEGETAQKLVDGVRAAGGVWSLEDLASYRTVDLVEEAGLRNPFRRAAILKSRRQLYAA